MLISFRDSIQATRSKGNVLQRVKGIECSYSEGRCFDTRPASPASGRSLAAVKKTHGFPLDIVENVECVVAVSVLLAGGGVERNMGEMVLARRSADPANHTIKL
jgi:hypothetical protein